MIGLLRSFGYAFQGVVACLLGERNFRIHTLAGAMAIAMGAYYRLSGTQWAVLLLAIALVLCCEAVNTAVEAAVDLVSPGEHPLAKLAKDCAAGAVLLAAAIAVPLVTDRSFAPLAAAAGYGLAVWYGFRQLDGMNGDISGFALTLGELAGAAVWTLVR